MNAASAKPASPIHAAFLAKAGCTFVDRIYDAPRRERIARATQLCPVVLTPENLAQYHKEAAQIEVLFTCWGFPFDLVTAENFPALRAMFYSGGSVKAFARPLLERGVQVVGGRSANGIAVAQFCLGQVILACKGFFRNTRECRDPAIRRAGCFAGPGMYGEKIALLGMGAVARELLPMVQRCDLKILAVDPYLKPEEARALNVTPVTMEEAFAQAYIVSNHLPNLPDLKGVLDGKLFSTMRPNATFINTGRGAQVNEADLIDVMQKRPDLTALLDVTDPEPPHADSPLLQLPNVTLLPHIGSASTATRTRMAELAATNLICRLLGKPLPHPVTT